MSQKSIQFLENISGLAYVPMSEPAHLVKDTFEQYFSGYNEDFSKSFKKAELKKISSTDISIKDIIDEIVEEYCRKEPDYFVPSVSISTIYRDLDSVAKTFDNVWFSDFCAIDRLHVAKKKLRKMFADFVGEEVKSYEIDKIQTIGDAIQFLDSKIHTEIDDSQCLESISKTHTAPVPIGEKHNTMPIDKSKIEYVIGIDLGHGETSAAICPIHKGVDAKDLEPAKDLEMGGNRKVIPSAIAILPMVMHI